MTIKLELLDNEDSSSALRRFNSKVQAESGRRWYKRRYGCYEKPSALNRKKNPMKKIVSSGRVLSGSGL